MPNKPRPCSLCGNTDTVVVNSHDGGQWHRCVHCGLLVIDEAHPVSVNNSRSVQPGLPGRLLRELANQTGVIRVVTDRSQPASIAGHPQLRSARQDIEFMAFDDLMNIAVGAPFQGLIVVDDTIRLQDDIVGTLTRIRTASHESARILFLVALHAPINGQRKIWIESAGRGKVAFDWVVFHKLLLACGFDRIWRFGTDRGRDLKAQLISSYAGPVRARKKLSVIMPVFNEKATFGETIERVLGKLGKLNNLDWELVLIESNSEDGTKELVKNHEGRPGIVVIWQERPRGKGNAVREGLNAATGDIILIQDADNEYDVNDYDILLDALLSWRTSFVLGARDTDAWKMRQFEDTPFMAMVYNFGHIFFTSVINLLLWTRFKDPFTMYKVFYRDCIHGLNFRCNRFDFDHELVIKLCRKGFIPIELPAFYRSRSHAEGKKVSLVKDGLTWIWTDILLRTEPLAIKEYR